MDVYDPQTLGFLVFGGFMIISALGIALVSTLSMKETSYEEALAKQRHQLVQTQTQKADKKKKDKTLEKKNKAKKKEDRPDGKLSDPGSDGGEEPEVVTCTEPESDPEPVSESDAAHEPRPMPEPEPEPTVVLATTIMSAPAPSPKEKKKKKSAKVEPAAVVETVAKEVLVTLMAPVVDASPVNVVPEVTKEPTAAKTEEPKETLSKKKKSKRPEPVTDSAKSSHLPPHGELLSAVSNMALSEDEMHKLMEVLNQKAGVRQGSWQLASQRGDPLSALKKQLEEKEKLLTSEQDGAMTAKNRLRELSKELGAEKSKMASLEARLKAEQSARVQEVNGLQAKIQTADQEHLKHTQQLNQKIGSLQEQLENGPNAQLARLQQENSILRDALNQATSQAESRQNAELACLRQDCVRLGRELTERTDALRTDEGRRKSLEAKMAAVEQELAQAQLVHGDTERALQQRLEEVCSDLKASQQEAAAVSELQGALVSREAELQELKVQLENKAAVQVDESSEVQQLKSCVQRRDEQVVALEAELAQLREELQLLTSSQRVKEGDAAAGDQVHKDGSGSETESEQPFESLEEDSQLLRLEEELQQLREELQQARYHGTELQEKMASSAAASSTAERVSEQREAELQAALTEAQSRIASLRLDFQASLQVLFPGVCVEAEQSDWLQLFIQTVQESKGEAERSHSESRLTEAQRKQTELQTEFDQKMKLLQETEAELQALQRRSEEEENVWKKKLCEAEQQKQTVLDQLQLLEDRAQTENTQQLKEQLMLLEAQLEKQLEEASFSQSCSEELAQVQSQLQQVSIRLQSEQEQRQQLDADLQQARQEVLELQQKLEAVQRSAASLQEAPVEVKEETPV
ncbi:ribosome-binding protein 1b isoform X2 [Pagrus major]|uniref:ribosome-binding protein 1b isoform X2 n=1 Tax=Pagrus major TaxID=143350 RepID=UPI003CC8A2BB